MKRRFYFHRQNEPLDTDHVIYVLWCGESVREQKLLAKMVAWSFEHHATLMSWDESIDYYLMIEAERVFPGKGLIDFGFVRVDINAPDLLTLMEDQSFDSFEACITSPKSYFSHLFCLSPASVDKAAGRIDHHRVLSSQRQNLSQKAQNDWSVIRFD